ncbi:O-antigen ligase [Mangrovibacterium marinum]|uniref:O-antigen ligase n=1 Tax=Mangrovibacterium marinum TaxID=1639118 RepID=A0A2T5BX13_9BACT|nr:O-antigen ligase family protein [Mangrovibacterium marinum]PTN04246.1 O-antigen ligase [Mangrovibacterium marinum]
MPIPRNKIKLVYGLIALFTTVNLWLVVSRGWLWFNLLPVAMALVLAAFRRLNHLLLLIVLFTPLSLPLQTIVPGFSFDMNLPTEPLLVGVLLLFLLRMAQKPIVKPGLLRHPVSVALLVYLGWMLLTCLSSTMPVVSLKYWLSKLWFVVAFYFLAFRLLEDPKNFYRFVLLYASGFLPVIAYSWWRQAGYGFFDHRAANFVMYPFFSDHTSYGAMLVFFIPALFVLTRMPELRRRWRLLATLELAVFAVALVLSYTRAAWLSLVVAAAVLPLLLLKVRFRNLLLTAGVVLVALWAFQDVLVEQLSANKQQSSGKLAGHLESMSNISTDASNVERLNRWSSALAMFGEKPLTGWGPGTYMFQYAPFQRTDLRTIISTNSGDGGNAHSEYLGALAESGLPGMLSLAVLVLVVLATAFRRYARTTDPGQRAIILAVTMALVSYFVHGFLNNFLDQDKAAIPVWFFVAVLVALDLQPSDKTP